MSQLGAYQNENHTIAISYSGTNLEYEGRAAPGSAKTAAVWQIRKFLYDGSSNLTDVQYADGNSYYDNIWNSRAALTYS